MGEEKKHGDEDAGGAQGGRRANEVSPAGGATVGPLGPGQCWSVARKGEVAQRLLRGESVAALSRELGVEIYRLEKSREKALSRSAAALKELKPVVVEFLKQRPPTQQHKLVPDLFRGQATLRKIKTAYLSGHICWRHAQ